MKLINYWKIIKRSWLAQFWMNIATVGVLALSLGIVFGSILFSHNVSRLLTVWGDEIQITIYLQDSIEKKQSDEIEQKLKSSEFITRFDFIDKVEAAKLFEKSLQNYGPQFLNSLKTDVGNPFPAAYHVQLKPEYKNPEKVNAIAEGFKTIGGVEDVSYGQEWVKNYTSLMQIARILGLVFGAVIFVGCIFTVSNSIRASLSTRREEIEILELIGATQTEIRKPFIIEGSFQGFIASVFAMIFLSVIYSYSAHFINGVLGAHSLAETLTFFSMPVLILMLLFGTLLGAFGSYLSVAKINTGWAAAEGVRPA